MSPRLIVFVNIYSSFGSKLTPAHRPPPIVAGKKIVHGVPPCATYAPPKCAGPFWFIRPSHILVCSGVILARSSRLKLLRARGGGFTGNGCVGQGLSFLAKPSCGT